MNAVDTAVFGELTHHQPVFTTADVIKTTGGSPVWATQSLSALAKEGLIAKVRRGLWALPGHADFSPYAIIPQLLRATKGEKTDVRGYVSLLSALNLHGMIDQAPHVIQIVAERIRPTVRTLLGHISSTDSTPHSSAATVRIETPATWCDYSAGTHHLHYWQTRARVEVDFIIYGESGLYAVEVKNSQRVRPEDLRALKSFAEDYPKAQLYLLYRGKDRLLQDGVLCIPCEEFLLALKPDRFPN